MNYAFKFGNVFVLYCVYYRLRLENIIRRIISDEGKEARLSAHHSWAWDRCKLDVTMNDQVKAGDLLKWIVGFWRFMKKHGYVEADMTFEKTHPLREVGTAIFRAIAVE